MVDDRNRVILSAGNRRDVEQIGGSLTPTNDVAGIDNASSGLFTFGTNDKLTNVTMSSFQVEMEPIKNLRFGLGFSYKTLESASSSFSLDYYTDLTQTTIKSALKQYESNIQIEYTPNRRTIGFGVERDISDTPYSTFFLNFSQGVKGVLSSDFDYQKLQLYYKQPIIIGPLGRSNITFEAGKTFGNVPLGLMSVVPGNQSFFITPNTFNNLDYYEFVTDQYVTLKWDHNFQGRLFARIPFMRKLNWRENVGINTIYGTVRDDNKTINASGLTYNTPEKVYWEYSAGISNIFKIFRLDFCWRGNYLDMPDATKFAVKGSFGFYF
jgi:hypothetical protein